MSRPSCRQMARNLFFLVQEINEERIMKEHLRHHLNPLHIYCRLQECGLKAPIARRVCEFYQRLYCLVL